MASALYAIYFILLNQTTSATTMVPAPAIAVHIGRLLTLRL